MPPIIEVNGISKQYRLGTIGTGSMTHDLNRWWYRLRGKEDPYLRIGEANDRSTKGSSEYVWALRDISFSVQPGEVLGIIGRNGAGKSTLLKILSRITTPSTGSIKLGGRVASLLEVGTGMHPELTGRENIYLNGAILGMRKKEIDRKLDAIVDFSGVERYLDTPVKRYSSGMHVRLGFAVAAHLEPEILIVDEVLAVGDAEFQKKCLGKMKDVSSNEGRTVLFVSHNMGTIAQLCTKSLLLENGLVISNETTSNVIEYYITNSTRNKFHFFKEGKDKSIFIKSVVLKNELDQEVNDFQHSESIFVCFNMVIKEINPSLRISLTIQSRKTDYLSTIVEPIFTIIERKIGEYKITVKLNPEVIVPNKYALRIALFVPNGRVYDLEEMICPFTIHDIGTKMALFEGMDYGYFKLGYLINEVIKINDYEKDI